MMLPSETWALDSTSQLRAWASDSGLREWVNTRAQLADAPSRIHEWKTHGGPGHEHETPFSNLITDIRPIALPAEREWPDQLVFLDQVRGRA